MFTIYSHAGVGIVCSKFAIRCAVILSLVLPHITSAKILETYIIRSVGRFLAGTLVVTALLVVFGIFLGMYFYQDEAFVFDSPTPTSSNILASRLICLIWSFFVFALYIIWFVSAPKIEKELRKRIDRVTPPPEPVLHTIIRNPNSMAFPDQHLSGTDTRYSEGDTLHLDLPRSSQSPTPVPASDPLVPSTPDQSVVDQSVVDQSVVEEGDTREGSKHSSRRSTGDGGLVYHLDRPDVVADSSALDLPSCQHNDVMGAVSIDDLDDSSTQLSDRDEGEGDCLMEVSLVSHTAPAIMPNTQLISPSTDMGASSPTSDYRPRPVTTTRDHTRSSVAGSALYISPTHMEVEEHRHHRHSHHSHNHHSRTIWGQSAVDTHGKLARQVDRMFPKDQQAIATARREQKRHFAAAASTSAVDGVRHPTRSTAFGTGLPTPRSSSGLSEGSIHWLTSPDLPPLPLSRPALVPWGVVYLVNFLFCLTETMPVVSPVLLTCLLTGLAFLLCSYSSPILPSSAMELFITPHTARIFIRWLIRVGDPRPVGFLLDTLRFRSGVTAVMSGDRGAPDTHIRRVLNHAVTLCTQWSADESLPLTATSRAWLKEQSLRISSSKDCSRLFYKYRGNLLHWFDLAEHEMLDKLTSQYTEFMRSPEYKHLQISVYLRHICAAPVLRPQSIRWMSDMHTDIRRHHASGVFLHPFQLLRNSNCGSTARSKHQRQLALRCKRSADGTVSLSAQLQAICLLTELSEHPLLSESEHKGLEIASRLLSQATVRIGPGDRSQPISRSGLPGLSGNQLPSVIFGRDFPAPIGAVGASRGDRADTGGFRIFDDHISERHFEDQMISRSRSGTGTLFPMPDDDVISDAFARIRRSESVAAVPASQQYLEEHFTPVETEFIEHVAPITRSETQRTLVKQRTTSVTSTASGAGGHPKTIACGQTTSHLTATDISFMGSRPMRRGHSAGHLTGQFSARQQRTDRRSSDRASAGTVGTVSSAAGSGAAHLARVPHGEDEITISRVLLSHKRDSDSYRSIRRSDSAEHFLAAGDGSGTTVLTSSASATLPTTSDHSGLEVKGVSSIPHLPLSLKERTGTSNIVRIPPPPPLIVQTGLRMSTTEPEAVSVRDVEADPASLSRNISSASGILIRSEDEATTSAVGTTTTTTTTATTITGSGPSGSGESRISEADPGSIAVSQTPEPPLSPCMAPQSARVEAPGSVCSSFGGQHMLVGGGGGIGGSLQDVDPQVLSEVLAMISQEAHSYDMVYFENNLTKLSFDTLRIELLTPHPLVYVGYRIFKSLGLIDKFELAEIRVVHFLMLAEGLYHQLPFHNAFHAADTAQFIATLISELRKANRHVVGDDELLALILAAISHDLDHRGLENKLLIQIDHPLVEQCGYEGTLEHHHARLSRFIVKCSGLIDHLDPSRRIYISQVMARLILVTDMTRHVGFQDDLRRALDESETRAQVNFRSFHGALQLGSNKKAPSHLTTVWRMRVLQTIMKMADINNSMRPRPIAEKWATRIMREFFHMGDIQRERGLPTPSFRDRSRKDVDTPQCQYSFITFIIMPYLKTASDLIRAAFLSGSSTLSLHQTSGAVAILDELQTNVQNNLLYWMQLGRIEP